MKTETALQTIIFLALLALLQGCGFHLRGTGTSAANLPADISPLLIEGLAQRDFLKLELENMFINSGIQVTNDTAEAASILRITGRQSDRRVKTVDSRGKVVEYELRESLGFELADRAGNLRAPIQSVSVIQIYTNRATQVLGSQQEESYLREDMWRRLSSQILRRLSTQLR